MARESAWASPRVAHLCVRAVAGLWLGCGWARNSVGQGRGVPEDGVERVEEGEHGSNLSLKAEVSGGKPAVACNLVHLRKRGVHRSMGTPHASVAPAPHQSPVTFRVATVTNLRWPS